LHGCEILCVCVCACVRLCVVCECVCECVGGGGVHQEGHTCSEQVPRNYAHIESRHPAYKLTRLNAHAGHLCPTSTIHRKWHVILHKYLTNVLVCTLFCKGTEKETTQAVKTTFLIKKRNHFGTGYCKCPPPKKRENT